MDFAELIAGSDPWDSFVCVNFASDGGWGGYAGGYLRAARLLTRHVEAHGTDRDYLVFPIGLLYRHHLELMFKVIGVEANRLLAQDPKFLTGHNLSRLWARCRAALETAYSPGSWDVDRYEVLVEALHEFDPGGETFRYPVTIKSEPTIPPEVQHINIRRMADVFEELASALDAIQMQMIVDADLRQEMEAAFQQAGWE